jgi:hypothetical protein
MVFTEVRFLKTLNRQDAKAAKKTKETFLFSLANDTRSS